MKTYIKPETIIADMLPAFSIMQGTGVKTNDKLGKSVVEDGVVYSKSDNAWDDFDE